MGATHRTNVSNVLIVGSDAAALAHVHAPDFLRLRGVTSTKGEHK